MNRKLLVNLLYKSIEELEMITEGFMEMDEYPQVIVQLAKRKTEDIQSILEQLIEIKPAQPVITEIPKTEEAVITVQDETTVSDESESLPADTEEEKEKSNVIEFIVEETETEEKVEFLEEIIEETETNEPQIETIELENLDEEFEKMQPVEPKKAEPEIIPEIVQTEDNTKKTSVISVESNQTIEETVIKVISEETKVFTLADKIAPTKISRSEKLSTTDNSLSASLANKKIDDIKQAISIGDRFRFQRELFNGNGEDMNKTLNYINQLATFEEVSSFLRNKYKWLEEDNDVLDFMQIVKRRFN